MIDFRNELQELLEEHGDGWTDADRAMVLDIGKDYGLLMAQKVAGEDVDASLVILNRQVAGVRAAATYSAQNLFVEAIERFGANLSSSLVTALLAVV